jgi:hypothetical protein
MWMGNLFRLSRLQGGCITAAGQQGHISNNNGDANTIANVAPDTLSRRHQQWY